jgi:hypothetical protein
MRSVRACAALLAAALSASAAPPPPGKLFNLSSFQLQLPVSNGGTGVEIIQPNALATFTSEFFFTDEGNHNAMTFWAPENGAHTSGSSYPRSELRQIPNWFFKGRSEMNVSMSVAKLPTGGAITVGQVHADGLSGHCSIIIELEYQLGDLNAHLRDSACKGVTKKVGSGYKLGDTFRFTLRVDGTSVSVVTDTGAMPPYAYSWATIGGIATDKVPIYFKAGDYIQTASSSAVQGGIVAISEINFFIA